MAGQRHNPILDGDTDIRCFDARIPVQFGEDPVTYCLFSHDCSPLQRRKGRSCKSKQQQELRFDRRQLARLRRRLRTATGGFAQEMR